MGCHLVSPLMVIYCMLYAMVVHYTTGAQTPGAPVWISDMKKGGAAYRFVHTINY